MITDYEQHCTCAILEQLLLIIVFFPTGFEGMGGGCICSYR